MYRLEMKRLLKTRSTLFLAAAMLAMSVFFACVTVAGAGSIGRGYITLHGMEAIEYHKELYAEAEGFVTPERIDAMARFSEAARAEYGTASEMPEKIYTKWISSEPVLSAVKIYGAGWEPDEYYQWRKDTIDAITSSFSNGAIRDTALALDSRVEEPFYWEYGFGSSEAQVNWSLLLFALCLTGVVMASPCFSQGYATGADSIMRCARVSRKASFGRISGSNLWVIVCEPTAKPQSRILRAHVLQNFSSAFVSMNVAFMPAFLNTSAILEWA